MVSVSIHVGGEDVLVVEGLVWAYVVMVYATDLLFSPRAPVRLSICVKHAFGGQDPHLNS